MQTGPTICLGTKDESRNKEASFDHRWRKRKRLSGAKLTGRPNTPRTLSQSSYGTRIIPAWCTNPLYFFFPQRMSGGGIPRTRFPYYLTSALRGLLQYPSTHIIDIPNRCRRVHAHVPTTSRSNSPICMSTHNHAWYPLPCVFVKQRQTKLLLFPEPSMDSTRLPKLTFYPGFPPPSGPSQVLSSLPFTPYGIW